MTILLDTTVLIDISRKRPAAYRVLEMFRRGENIVTSAINVEEYISGLRSTEKAPEEVLPGTLIVLEVGLQEASVAGTWRRQYQSRGITLSQADCLIAACASTSGSTLVTGNPKHFPMEGLRIEHWPVGE